MSTQGGEVKYVFTADSTQLQSAMARGQTAINSMATSAETAATKIDVGMNKASTSTTGLSVSANRAFKALGPIGGVLSRLDPEIGAVASSVAGLTSGFEGLEASGILPSTSALAAMAPILAVVGVAFVELTGVIGDYTSAKEEATRADAAFRAASLPLADALRAERSEREMLTKALNSSDPAGQLKIAKAQAAALKEEMEATAELRTQKEALVKELANEASRYEQIKKQDQINRIDEQIDAVHRQATELATLRVDNEELAMVVGSYTGELVKHNDTVDAAASADAAWAKVLSDGVLYNLELNMEASEKRAKVEKDNADIIAKAGEEAAMRQWEAEETLRQRRIEMEAERTALYAKGIEDRRELDLKAAESAVAIAENATDLIIQLAESEADTRSDIVDRLQQKLADGEDTLTKRQKQNIRERIKENKDAARTAFRISQAVAAVQAAISTALAIVNALASPVPYPVAVGFAVAAGIAGAASEAAILSEKPPTFHTGGVFAADEGMAKLRNGEGVLTPETTRNLGGASGIAEMNRRQGIAGGGTVLRIGRREVAEMERMGVLGGGPRNRQIRNEVRRGSIIAGRSGKGVLA